MRLHQGRIKWIGKGRAINYTYKYGRCLLVFIQHFLMFLATNLSYSISYDTFDVGDGSVPENAFVYGVPTKPMGVEMPMER